MDCIDLKLTHQAKASVAHRYLNESLREKMGRAIRLCPYRHGQTDWFTMLYNFISSIERPVIWSSIQISSHLQLTF